ncbi:methyl-accepting chemotaxis protein, partial [Variovorax sp. J22R115]|nr:methyl-accepting chemotaxis protein [Variovorax sp. J22R115]
DQVTQQNAALVEEASAAAQSLQEQAGSLSQVVSVFRLGRDTQAPPAPARTPSVAGAAAKAAPKARAKAQAEARKKTTRTEPQLAAASAGAGDWTEF